MSRHVQFTLDRLQFSVRDVFGNDIKRGLGSLVFFNDDLELFEGEEWKMVPMEVLRNKKILCFFLLFYIVCVRVRVIAGWKSLHVELYSAIVSDREKQ